MGARWMAALATGLLALLGCAADDGAVEPDGGALDISTVPFDFIGDVAENDCPWAPPAILELEVNPGSDSVEGWECDPKTFEDPAWVLQCGQVGSGLLLLWNETDATAIILAPLEDGSLCQTTWRGPYVAGGR
jgi:hypothetical protein